MYNYPGQWPSQQSYQSPEAWPAQQWPQQQWPPRRPPRRRCPDICRVCPPECCRRRRDRDRRY